MSNWFRNGICLALIMLLLLGCSSAVASDEVIEVPMTFVTLKNMHITDIANDTKAGGTVYAAIVTNMFSIDGVDGLPINNMFLGSNFIIWNELSSSVILWNYEESSGIAACIVYHLGDTSASLLLRKATFTMDEMRVYLSEQIEDDFGDGVYELSEDDIKAGMDSLASAIE